MSSIFFIDMINDCCRNSLSSGKLNDIPYHQIAHASDIAKKMRDIDTGILLNFILGHGHSSSIFRILKKSGLLKHLFVHLDQLSDIPQKKRRAKNVFQHTTNVISKVPLDNYMLKWAALLHDIGKYDTWQKNKNFKNHEIYSHQTAITILDRLRVLEKERILKVIRHHMYPLEYQRNPVWKEESIIKMIDTCGPEYILSIIEFSIYDKLSEQNIKTIAPLIILTGKVKNILNEKYKITPNRSQVSFAS